MGEPLRHCAAVDRDQEELDIGIAALDEPLGIADALVEGENIRVLLLAFTEPGQKLFQHTYPYKNFLDHRFIGYRSAEHLSGKRALVNCRSAAQRVHLYQHLRYLPELNRTTNVPFR